jgi:acyl-CoA thioester hydrolase
MFKTTRRVEFRDTDAAGIMHFSVFFTAMESAENEFLRSRGLGVVMPDPAGDIGFPRVAARCDYQSPLRFEDEYQIEVRVARIGSKSVTYEFVFTHRDRAVATGGMTSVCCRMASEGRPTSIPIPEWILEKLRGGDSKS